MPRPRSASLLQDLPQIQPAPGGRRREYWIQANTVNWEITPLKRDEWHNRKLPKRYSYRAYCYQEMTAGSPRPSTCCRCPGRRCSPRSAT